MPTSEMVRNPLDSIPVGSGAVGGGRSHISLDLSLRANGAESYRGSGAGGSRFLL